MFACAVAIFIAGYALQLHSLHGLQAELRPQLPGHGHPVSSAYNGKNDATRQDGPLQTSAELDWQRLAHVQIIRSHAQVCSSIMILASLAKAKSPARRVAVFPRDWARDTGKGKGLDTGDPYVDASRRLLRKAARRYGVQLRPVEGLQDTKTWDAASSLGGLQRALIVRTPGMVLGGDRLDALLVTPPSPSSELHDTEWPLSDLVMLEQGRDGRRAQVSSNDTALILSIGSIRTAEAAMTDADVSAMVSPAAYIQFSDPLFPDPEYDVPFATKLAARPKSPAADWAWTKFYREFAQQRLETCGLGLAPWHEGF